MAKLINGNGNSAVYASEDSDWYAAIMGNVTSITAIGEQFRADQADANTIEVFDGVIITQEGRRIQLDANDVDLFTIPTGTPGDTSYYIIGYHLVTDSDSNQSCETFVQKMEDGTETIPEDTFRGGADDVYISLYRITQDGLNIDSIDLLLPSISNISEIKSDLMNKKDISYSHQKVNITASTTETVVTTITVPADKIAIINAQVVFAFAKPTSVRIYDSVGDSWEGVGSATAVVVQGTYTIAVTYQAYATNPVNYSVIIFG